MIIPDKKRYQTFITSRRREPSGEVVSGPGSVKPEISKEENGEMDGRHQAAEDAILALGEKSPQKFMEALANFIDLHHLKASEPPKE